MKAPVWVPILFGLMALYDGLLGLLFLVAPTYAFAQFSVPPPNHPGYVQFPAALLVVFGWMFVQIARNPVGNRGLIVYGILLKVAYCAVAGGHWLTSGIPAMWKPLVIIDGVTALLFVWAYLRLHRTRWEPQGGRSSG